jgi:hypothetical protein
MPEDKENNVMLIGKNIGRGSKGISVRSSL